MVWCLFRYKHRVALNQPLLGILLSAGYTHGVGKVFMKSRGMFPAAVSCKDLAGRCFPFVCQAEKGGDIKEIEDNFVQESVTYQFVLREMPATYFQVCKS